MPHTTTSHEPRREFPDALIKSVKQRTSLLSLLNRYGIAAKRVGNGYKAICPFHKVDGHSERTPSLSINTLLNVFKCFSCNESGDAITFVMKLDGLDFIRAVEKLLSLTPAPVSSKEEPEAAKEEIQPTQPQISEEERQTILREVVRRSINDLRNSQDGRKYLESRGLDPLPLLESYDFGFCNGKTFDTLDESQRKKLQTVGLLSGSRALFENCVIFPWSTDGRIATIYGRKAAAVPPTGDGFGRHYLLPGQRGGLFLPKAGLNPQRPVVIVESTIDSLSLFAAGITNVLGLLGTNGFLADHLTYLKQQNFAGIYIALNGDTAGNRAAAQLRSNLAAQKLTSEIITLPEGKDVNDMLLELGPGKLKEWFIERAPALAGVQTDEGKPTVWEDDKYTYITLDDREYRLLLESCGLDRLRVMAKVYNYHQKQNYLIDKLDLYHARSREHFIAQVTKTLTADRDVIARDVNTIITVLEELRLKDEEQKRTKTVEISEEDRHVAMARLKDLLAGKQVGSFTVTNTCQQQLKLRIG